MPDQGESNRCLPVPKASNGMSLPRPRYFLEADLREFRSSEHGKVDLLISGATQM